MVSDEIIKVLNDLSQRFGVVLDWTNQEVMPKLQELSGKLISYEIYTSWIYVGLFVFALISAVVLIILDVKFDWYGIGIVIGMISFIISVIALFCVIPDLVACYTFPEKIIIDYISSYLN